MPYEKEMKGIKLLQDRALSVGQAHNQIGSELAQMKDRLDSIPGAREIVQSEEFIRRKNELVEQMSVPIPLEHTPLNEVLAEAEANYVEPAGLADILNIEDFAEIERRVGAHVVDFNRRYGLDGWDYAIACSCGLFAAMLDLLCIRAPMNPTVAFTQEVDGIINKAVQKAFNTVLAPELSKALSMQAPIGAPDSSTVSNLLAAPAKALNPINHRLRSVAHDPILGFIFGVLDMQNGTCTTVVDGNILRIPSTKGPTEGNIFQLLGRMLGHLLSDVNAPSGNGNRGMGLPAPFMGLLRMLESIPINDSNFGRQIEWMYVNGYDFRQFTVSSAPMAIMEVLLRAFYVAKQIKCHDVPFCEGMLETIPGQLSPRFRMILAIAYGTSSAVNAGKMLITGNILNANYASWMGLAWNGFHSLKWALLEKHLTFWGELEEKELGALEELVGKLEDLKDRAERLPG